jgi:hypothetical protein
MEASETQQGTEPQAQTTVPQAPAPADAPTAAAGSDAPQGEQPQASDFQQRLSEQMERVAEGLNRLPAPPPQQNPLAQAAGFEPPPPVPQTDPRLQAGQPPVVPAQALQGQPPQQQYDPQQGAVEDPALQQVEQYVESLAEAKAREAVAPVLQSIQQERRQQDAQALLDDFPELRDPQQAGEAVRQAEQYARSMGVPQLGREPAFIELALLASRQLASGQDGSSGGSEGGVQLETQGGAGLPPAPADAAQQEADAIVAVSRPATEADRILGLQGSNFG